MAEGAVQRKCCLHHRLFLSKSELSFPVQLFILVLAFCQQKLLPVYRMLTFIYYLRYCLMSVYKNNLLVSLYNGVSIRKAIVMLFFQPSPGGNDICSCAVQLLQLTVFCMSMIEFFCRLNAAISGYVWDYVFKKILQMKFTWLLVKRNQHRA